MKGRGPNLMRMLEDAPVNLSAHEINISSSRLLE